MSSVKERLNGKNYYNSLPKETQSLITKVMLSTIDMCNELLSRREHIVFFEDVAYQVLRDEMLNHMLKEEWFDSFGSQTWKNSGEVTSWDGKRPVKTVNNIQWKDPDELDDYTKPIVYWTGNGKVGTFKENICLIGGKRLGTEDEHKRRWINKCEKYNIVKWCYQEEIAPLDIK